MLPGGLHTFWDEEKQRAELYVDGCVLYGSNEDAMEVMAEINNLRLSRDRAKAALRELRTAHEKRITEILLELGS